MEGSSLYRIAVDLVARDTNLAGPFEQIVKLLERIKADSEAIKVNLAGFAAPLENATRAAQAFRDAMREARDNARTARQSMDGMDAGPRRYAGAAPNYGEAPRRNRPRAAPMGSYSSSRSEEGDEEYPPVPAPRNERRQSSAPPIGYNGSRSMGAYSGGQGRVGPPDSRIIDVPWDNVPLVGYDGERVYPGGQRRLGGPPPTITDVPYAHVPSSGGSAPSGGGGSPPGGGGPPPPPPPPPPPNGQPPRGRLPRGPALEGGEAGIIYDAALLAARITVEPAFSQEQTLATVQASRGKETADIFRNAAHEVQRAVPATNLKSNYALLNAFMALTQDPKEAAQFLRDTAPAGVALAQLNPAAGDYEHQLDTSSRIGEFLGLVTGVERETGKRFFQADEMRRLLDRIVKLTQVTNGKIDPSKLFKFLTSAKNAGATIDLDDLSLVAPTIMSMPSPQQAGTALLAFNQQFVGGKTNAAIIDMLIGLNYIKGGGSATTNKNVKHLFSGEYQILPEGVDPALVRQAQEHPVQFLVERIRPLFDAEINKRLPKGQTVDTISPKERSEQEAQMATAYSSRIPGGGFIAGIFRQLDNAKRDLEAMKNLPNNAIGQLNDTPKARVDAFTNSLNHLLTTLGTPLIDTGTKALATLATGINAFASIFDHPSSQKNLGMTYAVSGVAAATAVSPMLFMPAAAIAAASHAGYIDPTMHVLTLHSLQEIRDAIKHVWDDRNRDTPQKVQVMGGQITIANPRDIAVASANIAATVISAPHASAPTDHARAIPAQPGDR